MSSGRSSNIQYGPSGQAYYSANASQQTPEIASDNTLVFQPDMMFNTGGQQNFSSNSPDQDGDRSRRRIPVACGRCRKRKIKCSGSIESGPCSNCRGSPSDPNQCNFHRVSSTAIGWDTAGSDPIAGSLTRRASGIPSHSLSEYPPTGFMSASQSAGAEALQYQSSAIGNTFSQYHPTMAQSAHSPAPFGYSGSGIEGYLQSAGSQSMGGKSYASRAGASTPSSHIRQEYNVGNMALGSMGCPATTSTSYHDRQLPAPISTRQSAPPNGSSVTSPASLQACMQHDWGNSYQAHLSTPQHQAGCPQLGTTLAPQTTSGTHGPSLPTLAHMLPSLDSNGPSDQYYSASQNQPNVQYGSQGRHHCPPQAMSSSNSLASDEYYMYGSPYTSQHSNAMYANRRQSGGRSAGMQRSPASGQPRTPGRDRTQH